MIERQEYDGVTVLRLRHGKANALDRELLESICRQLESLREEAASAVVLTGQGSIFSAGVDLHRLLAEDSAYVAGMITALNEGLAAMARFPRPLVAAMNGHAIAGGLVVACGCDYRIMVEGDGKVGLTELQVGVPFPPAALEVVRAAVGTATTRELVYHRRLYGGADALRLGLVNELVAEQDLLTRALEVAGELGRIPPRAFALTKQQLLAPMHRRLEALSVAHEDAVLREWVAEDTLAAVRHFVEQTLEGER